MTVGRAVRAVEIGTGEVAAHADAIADLHQDRLDALLVRGAFPDAVRRALLPRLDDALPWERPNRTGPQADIRVLGVAATPTFATPGGPPVDAYFDAATRHDDLYDGLRAPIEAVLGGVAGGRAIRRLAHPDGRPFAACTIRSLPEGQRIIVHNDFYHFKLPVYRDVLDGLDTTCSLSFLILLQEPEAGGELMIHGLAQDDPTPRLPGGFPDGAAIQAQYPGQPVAMRAGDVLLFAAGRLYHHVAPVQGARPRITLGGFLTLDRDHRSVIYWN